MFFLNKKVFSFKKHFSTFFSLKNPYLTRFSKRGEDGVGGPGAAREGRTREAVERAESRQEPNKMEKAQ